MLKYLFVMAIIILCIASYPRIQMLLDEETLTRIPALDILDPKSLERGLVEMSKHRVVICGITRDNALFFETMRKSIESIGTKFADYRVILFENDSGDGTKKLLSTWQIQNPKVTILTQDFHNQKRPNIKFLADSRNYYLQALKQPQYNNFDIMMVVDMDMLYGYDIRGIEHSFAQINRWDAVCSNGIGPGDKMYDAFAFRDQDFPYTPYEVGLKKYWDTIVLKIQRVIPVSRDLMSVNSCFGGLAFYKRNKIHNCLYDSKEGDCEHVAFHTCIKEYGKAEIFMNPAQILRASHYDYLTLALYALLVKTREVWSEVMLQQMH